MLGPSRGGLCGGLCMLVCGCSVWRLYILVVVVWWSAYVSVWLSVSGTCTFSRWLYGGMCIVVCGCQ